MREPLTEIQQRAAEFMRDYHVQHDIPPTIRHVSGFLGSKYPCGAASTVGALVRKGWVRRVKHTGQGQPHYIHSDIVTTIRSETEQD
jgi:SOS-response transcriptional repressor LexA